MLVLVTTILALHQEIFLDTEKCSFTGMFIIVLLIKMNIEKSKYSTTGRFLSNLLFLSV